MKIKSYPSLTMAWLSMSWLGGALFILLLIIYASCTFSSLTRARATPNTTTMTTTDPSLVDYARHKKNFLPQPYDPLRGKYIQNYNLPATFLNFQLTDKNAIDVANMYGNFLLNYNDERTLSYRHTLSFEVDKTNKKPYQLWSLPTTRFKPNFSQSGVYRIESDNTAVTLEGCATACEADPYCTAFGVVGKTTTNAAQCWRSTLHPLAFLQQFHSNIYTTDSPVEKHVGDTVSFLLRRPVFLMGLKESQCTCTTLCALKDATGLTSLYNNDGSGTALGTLDMSGLYYPSGELILPAAAVHTQMLINNSYSVSGTQPNLAHLLLDNQAPIVLPTQTEKYPTYYANLAENYDTVGAGSRGKVCVCIQDKLAVPYVWPTNLVPTVAQTFLGCPIQLPPLTTNYLGVAPIIGPPTNGYINS